MNSPEEVALHVRLRAGSVCQGDVDGKDGPRRGQHVQRQGLQFFLIKLSF